MPTGKTGALLMQTPSFDEINAGIPRARRTMGGKLLSSLTLARSHTGAAAVLVDEFDASHLECTSYKLKGGSTRLD